MKKLALLLGSILFLSGCKSTGLPIESPTPTPTPQSQSEGEFGKIAQAIASGKLVVCSIQKKDGSSTMTYTVMGKKLHVSGITYQGKTAGGEMISDGEIMYSWDMKTKQGIKMKLPSEKDVADLAKENGQSVPSIKSEADKKRFEDDGFMVTCKEGGATADVFMVPTDVKFMDISTLMKATPPAAKMMAPNASPDIKALEKNAQEMMKQYAK